MKTSNKWVLAALLLLFGSLTAYNMGLRAEYRRGTYKDPLRNTTALGFRNFSEVDVPGAGTIGVKIVAGPYGVRLSNRAAEFVHITQQGPRLVVALAFPGEVKFLGPGPQVTISCPRLAQLSASAVYTAEGKLVTDKQQRDGGMVRVQGFRQDSLIVQQNYATLVELADNHLGYLRAEAGAGPGSKSVLYIEKSNRIQAADLRVQSRSELRLEAGNIARLVCQFGDSATATLTGAGLGSMGSGK